MTLNPIGRSSILASLTAEDMRCYHIKFSTMSASDNATRILLDDMLSVMSHMGLRRFGDRVTIECRPHADGGCDMLFVVSPPVKWLFEKGDDLLSAMRAGALPDQPSSLEKSDDGWLLTFLKELSPEEAALLAEFCTPLNSTV